jgi:selenocysteine lyase/cysteine desulfurase
VSLGPPQIEQHAIRLAQQFDDGIEERGLPVLRPSPGGKPSSIVAVGSRLEAGLDTTSDLRLADLRRHLLARRIAVSVRRGVLRFSLHAYNNAADVEETLRSVTAWQSQSG